MWPASSGLLLVIWWANAHNRALMLRDIHQCSRHNRWIGEDEFASGADVWRHWKARCTSSLRPNRKRFVLMGPRIVRKASFFRKWQTPLHGSWRFSRGLPECILRNCAQCMKCTVHSVWSAHTVWGLGMKRLLVLTFGLLQIEVNELRGNGQPQ